MPISFANRWKCQIVSPIDGAVLWEAEAPTTKSLVDIYQSQTGNTYLTLQKLNRTSLGRSKNEMIKLYKIGEFATRNVELGASSDDSE